MIKINFIEILIFTLLILFKFAYCNNNIEATENESDLSEMLHRSQQHKLTLQDLIGVIDSNNNEEYVNKRGGVWFGPRLGKRSKRSIDSDSTRNELTPDEVYEIPLDKLTFDSFQNSPYIIYLLTEKQQPIRNNKNRYLTPRLGRDTVELLEIQRARPPFAPRLGKKAIPFSPRLGRQLFEIPEQQK